MNEPRRQTTHTSLSAKLEAAHVSIEKLREKLHTRTQHVKCLEAQEQQFNEDLVAYKSLITELKTSNEEVIGELDLARKKITTLQRDRDSFEALNKGMEKSNKELRDERDLVNLRGMLEKECFTPEGTLILPAFVTEPPRTCASELKKAKVEIIKRSALGGKLLAIRHALDTTIATNYPELSLVPVKGADSGLDEDESQVFNFLIHLYSLL